MQKMALEEYLDKKLDKAYQTLKKLIEDRNYFILSYPAFVSYLLQYQFVNNSYQIADFRLGKLRIGA